MNKSGNVGPPGPWQQPLFLCQIFTLVGPLVLIKFCVLAKGEPFHGVTI